MAPRSVQRNPTIDTPLARAGSTVAQITTRVVMIMTTRVWASKANDQWVDQFSLGSTEAYLPVSVTG